MRGVLNTHALPRSVPSAPACGCVCAWRVFFLCGVLELLVYDSNLHTAIQLLSWGSVGLLAVDMGCAGSVVIMT